MAQGLIVTAASPPNITRQEANVMNPNLSTSYVAIQTERSRLTTQAESGWETEQAADPSRLPSVVTMLCRSLGGLLVLSGERLQGTRPQAQAPDSYSSRLV
jgi:hypothetical protein